MSNELILINNYHKLDTKTPLCACLEIRSPSLFIFYLYSINYFYYNH